MTQGGVVELLRDVECAYEPNLTMSRCLILKQLANESSRRAKNQHIHDIRESPPHRYL